MSLFISLSSTSKIFGILISPSPGNPGSGCLAARLAVCHISKRGRISVRDSRRASEPVLLHENCETVPLDRLYKIIGGAQGKTPRLVVHGRNHSHCNLRQS